MSTYTCYLKCATQNTALSLSWTVRKDSLRRLAAGIYTDGQVVYVDMREFLEEHQMPDCPEVREEVLAQARKEFGNVSLAIMEELKNS